MCVAIFISHYGKQRRNDVKSPGEGHPAH